MERLDRALQNQTGLSRKKVKALLDEGRVFVNGRKVIIASWSVKKADVIEVKKTSEDPSAAADPYFLKVLFEDDALLVVEKDAGIACEKSALSTRPSLVAIINAYLHRKYPHLKHHYLGLVHRLDQETSGVMVYTKKKEANKITAQFKTHRIQRRYLAVVSGSIEAPHGKIESYLKKDSMLPGGKKVALATAASGRKALTFFQVKERYPNASLVEIKLDTGRTHQIRVHFSSIGHPIFGDKIYGKDQTVPFARQALHASFLMFRHPLTGQKMEFRSELPRDMRRLVDRLRLGS